LLGEEAVGCRVKKDKAKSRILQSLEDMDEKL